MGKVSPHLRMVQRIFLTPDFAMLNQLAFQNVHPLKEQLGWKDMAEKKNFPRICSFHPSYTPGAEGHTPQFRAPCHKPKIPSSVEDLINLRHPWEKIQVPTSQDCVDNGQVVDGVRKFGAPVFDMNKILRK